MIGIIATIGSISMILSLASNFDAGIGMKRFLGIAYSEEKWSDFKATVSTVWIFVIFSGLVLLFLVINPWFNILEIIGIDSMYIPIIFAIVIGNSLQSVCRNALTSMLKSQKIIFPAILSGLSRFVVLIPIILFFESTSFEMSFAYSMFYISIGFILSIVLWNELRNKKGRFFVEFRKNISIVIKASMFRWIPIFMGLVGGQASILALFSFKGPAESGLFYIPYAVFAILVLISNSITSVLHPILSGMKEEKSQVILLNRSLKITYIITMPLAVMAFFYSDQVLQIFGKDFVVSSEILSILVMSYPFLLFNEGIFFFLFAKAKYKETLILGLSANIPRLILYFILIPEIGSIGAAYALVIGTILQTFTTLVFVRRLRIRIPSKDIVFVSIISFLIGVGVYFSNIGIVGVILIWVATNIIFLKIKLLNSQNIEEVFALIYPQDIAVQKSDRIIRILSKLKII